MSLSDRFYINYDPESCPLCFSPLCSWGKEWTQKYPFSRTTLRGIFVCLSFYERWSWGKAQVWASRQHLWSPDSMLHFLGKLHRCVAVVSPSRNGSSNLFIWCYCLPSFGERTLEETLPLPKTFHRVRHRKASVSRFCCLIISLLFILWRSFPRQSTKKMPWIPVYYTLCPRHVVKAAQHRRPHQAWGNCGMAHAAMRQRQIQALLAF